MRGNLFPPIFLSFRGFNRSGKTRSNSIQRAQPVHEFGRNFMSAILLRAAILSCFYLASVVALFGQLPAGGLPGGFAILSAGVVAGAGGLVNKRATGLDGRLAG